MTQPVIRRTESHVSVSDGRRLFRRAWIPEEAQRVLLLVHGYAEHSGRYEHVGAWFARRGAAVHAYDHQGHGHSSGRRCHVRRFSDLCDDLDDMLTRVAREHPGVPLYLVGHSMGGLVVAKSLSERRPPVAGAVTSGPALAIGEGVSRVTIAAGRMLRWVAPRRSIDLGLDPEGLSRDPEVVRAYIEDPLVSRRTTLGMAAEVIGAIKRIPEAANRIQVPLLMLHGEADPICPVAGSRRFFGRLVVADKQLRTYPALRHEIFNEPEREAVFADVQAWLGRRP